MGLHDKYTKKFVGAVSTMATALLVTVVVPYASAHVAHADSTPVSPFVKVDSAGQPARWNPCAPLRWKLAGAHPSRRLHLAAQNTFRQVAATSGLAFTYAGRATATEFAAPPMNTIVIGATANLGMAGAGGMTNVFYAPTMNGGWAISGARVAVNPIVVARGTRFSSYLLPIVLHEVGHAMGLAHVANSSEIMYPQVVKASGYTTEARLDLRELGASMGCLAPVTSTT